MVVFTIIVSVEGPVGLGSQIEALFGKQVTAKRRATGVGLTITTWHRDLHGRNGDKVV
jgi:hypothetical protein